MLTFNPVTYVASENFIMELANLYDAGPKPHIRKEQVSSGLEGTGFERLNHIVNSHCLVQGGTITLPPPELYVSSCFESYNYS